jgi:sarcosine oxidase gamma subunit
VNVHRRAGATIEMIDGWEVAVRFLSEPQFDGNALVDVAHRRVYEVSGPHTGDVLQSLCEEEVGVRSIHQLSGVDVYRLTHERAILVGDVDLRAAVDVTGGWSSLALFGGDARGILAKVCALDLRDEVFPVGSCAQGPVFGVNTLIGRFPNRYELAVCPDMLEFLWEVLLDAGTEFQLRPAGLLWLTDREEHSP